MKELLTKKFRSKDKVDLQLRTFDVTGRSLLTKDYPGVTEMDGKVIARELEGNKEAVAFVVRTMPSEEIVLSGVLQGKVMSKPSTFQSPEGKRNKNPFFSSEVFHITFRIDF